jgi:hypothetical protein
MSVGIVPPTVALNSKTTLLVVTTATDHAAAAAHKHRYHTIPLESLKSSHTHYCGI